MINMGLIMDHNELAQNIKLILEKIEDMSHKINLLDENLTNVRDDVDKRFDGVENKVKQVWSDIEERIDSTDQYLGERCDDIEKKLEDFEYNISGE